MSEIKSENFSMRKSEPTEYIVKPCFCCDMKHESFYNFINIWDILVFCLAITGSILQISVGKLEAGIGLFFNIVSLMLVLISYVIYYNQQNYGLFIHKFYSITRLVFSCIELLAVVIGFFVVIFIRLPRHIAPYRWALILGVISVGLLGGLNLYWSLLLMKVVSRRSRQEGGQNSEDSNQPAVILESQDALSQSQRSPEGDTPQEQPKTPSKKDLSDLVN